MAECGYFGLGKTCNVVKNPCIVVTCKQHPQYYRQMAKMDAEYMQKNVGKKVRAYRDTRKYLGGNHCIHGRIVKVFVKGNSVAYKVIDGQGNIITCSFVEVMMFQD